MKIKIKFSREEFIVLERFLGESTVESMKSVGLTQKECEVIYDIYDKLSEIA